MTACQRERTAAYVCELKESHKCVTASSLLDQITGPGGGKRSPAQGRFCVNQRKADKGKFSNPAVSCCVKRLLGGGGAIL